MNAETTPKMKLSKLEKKYWQLLVERSSHEWDEIDNFMASHMARDLGLVEELVRNQAADSLVSDMCKRIHEGSQLLKLDTTGTTRNPNTQRMIVETIFKGI